MIPPDLLEEGGLFDVEYSTRGHFAGHIGNYMGVFQKRELSPDSEEQDISMVFASHLRGYAYQYPFYNYDLLLSGISFVDHMDGDPDLFCNDTAYGAGIFSLCGFYYL